MTTPVAKDPLEPASAGDASNASRFRFSAMLSHYQRDSAGATSIEYALITGLVFLAIVTAIQAYAGSVTKVYAAIETAITQR